MEKKTVVILAIKKEKWDKDEEDFGGLIKRLREKYADELGTNTISLHVI